MAAYSRRLMRLATVLRLVRRVRRMRRNWARAIEARTIAGLLVYFLAPRLDSTSSE